MALKQVEVEERKEKEFEFENDYGETIWLRLHDQIDPISKRTGALKVKEGKIISFIAPEGSLLFIYNKESCQNPEELEDIIELEEE